MRPIGARRARPQRHAKPTAAMRTSTAPPSSTIAATPRRATTGAARTGSWTARPRPSRLAEAMNLFFCSALEVVIGTTGREQVQCHRRPSVSAHVSAFSAFDGAWFPLLTQAPRRRFRALRKRLPRHFGSVSEDGQLRLCGIVHAGQPPFRWHAPAERQRPPRGLPPPAEPHGGCMLPLRFRHHAPIETWPATAAIRRARAQDEAPEDGGRRIVGRDYSRSRRRLYSRPMSRIVTRFGFTVAARRSTSGRE